MTMYGWTKMPPNFGQEPPAPVGAASIWAQGLTGQTGRFGLPEGCEKSSDPCGSAQGLVFNKITGKLCPPDAQFAAMIRCGRMSGVSFRRDRVAAIRGAITKAKLESWPLGARAQLEQNLAIEQGHLAVAESQEAEAIEVSKARLQPARPGRDSPMELFERIPWWGWLLGGVVLVRAMR